LAPEEQEVAETAVMVTSVDAVVMGETSGFDAEFSTAMLGFNGEAVLYCQGISDSVAREYAMEYTRVLQSRAKGIETQQPRIPAGLFEPNRNLIRSTLERMYEKYFQSS
jgi:hypothetical protein